MFQRQGRIVSINSAAVLLLVAILLFGLSQVSPVLAHGGQDWIYPGVNCRLRGDALREGLSNSLGVSQFGFISNINETRFMPVVCPVPRGAITKTSGINVSVKFSSGVRSQQQADLETEFRCELRNINSNGNGSTVIARTTSSQLGQVRPNDPTTFSLQLDSSNRVQNLGARDGGGYMLFCSLPPVRFIGNEEVTTRLIHYAVSERD